MSKTNPRPPLRELFADPSAGVVWSAIQTLSTAAQHEILAELQRLLGLTVRLDSHGTRVARAISALREVAEIVGHAPTSSEYRQVRAERPELKLPADGTLQGWLGGSWNDALKQARLDAVAGGDVLVREYGPTIEGEEILQALRDCAADLETIPTISQYLSWSRRPDVKARPGRRPSSQPPFDRGFGGFLPALKASGVINGETLTRMPRSTQVRLGSYFVGEEAACEALRWVTERIGRSPRVREYILEREKLIAESAEAGDPKSLPSPSTIQLRYGTWDKALEAAGLEVLGGKGTYSIKGNRGRPAGPRVTLDEVAAVLREAYAEIGEPFTVDAFQQWRAEQQRRELEQRTFRELPGITAIRARLGLWKNAVSVARSQDDDAAGAQAAAV